MRDEAGRRRLAGNPASAVYGTILVAGQLAVESATDDSTGQMLGSLGATLIVFWLAHAYTDSLGGVLAGARSGGLAGAGVEPPSLLRALRAEWPIVEAGVLPALVLLIGAVAGARPSSAAVAALVVADIELVLWAALAARRTSVPTGRKVMFTVFAGVLGLVIVALKYAIH